MPKPQREPGRTFLTAYAELLNRREARRAAQAQQAARPQPAAAAEAE